MWIKIFSLSFLGLGIFVLTQVILPILDFKKWELTYLKDNLPLTAPIKGVSISVAQGNFPSIVSNIKRQKKPNFNNFTLSIPKLAINNANVEVESNDIDKYLAHLPGTALPGERGNVFISGHSSGLINIKGDNFYRTIFASLSKLKPGDEIKIIVGGQQFSYKVSGFRIVNPRDLSVVEPPDYEGRYITLMTCVPPGLNTKRLIVIGKLE